MNDNTDVQIRQLCYRLRRQGVLELDAWLDPLVKHLKSGNYPELVAAAKSLLTEEPPSLLAMMNGDRSIPESLLPWLGLKRG